MWGALLWSPPRQPSAQHTGDPAGTKLGCGPRFTGTASAFPTHVSEDSEEGQLAVLTLLCPTGPLQTARGGTSPRGPRATHPPQASSGLPCSSHSFILSLISSFPHLTNISCGLTRRQALCWAALPDPDCAPEGHFLEVATSTWAAKTEWSLLPRPRALHKGFCLSK